MENLQLQLNKLEVIEVHLKNLEKIKPEKVIFGYKNNFFYFIAYTSNEKLKIILNQGEISFVSLLEENEFGIAFDAKFINKILKIIKNQKSMDLIIHTKELLLKNKRLRVSIPLLELEEEKIDFIEEKEKDIKKISLNQNLIKGLKYCYHSIDGNINNTLMMGTELAISEGQISVCSTDSKRMSIMAFKSLNARDDYKVVLYKRTVKSISNYFSDEDEVETFISKSEIQIKKENLIYQSSLINTGFPNWKEILKKFNNFKEHKIIKLNREKMLNVVKIASLFDKEIVVFTKEGKLILSDLDGNFAIYGDVEGIEKDFYFKINSKYIGEILYISKDENFELKVAEANIPILLKFGLAADIIMPLIGEKESIKKLIDSIVIDSIEDSSKEGDENEKI